MTTTLSVTGSGTPTGPSKRKYTTSGPFGALHAGEGAGDPLPVRNCSGRPNQECALDFQQLHMGQMTDVRLLVAIHNHGMSDAPNAVRVLVADDKPVVREAISLLLEAVDGFEVVGRAGDCDELLRVARDLRPDVILLDIGPKGDDCLAATQRLKLRHPEFGVLLFRAEMNDEQVQRARACGAEGVVLKTAPVPEVLDAIAIVADGGVVVGADLVAAGSSLLSVREQEVLRLMAAGMNNREISQALFIALGTTKSHVENIARKLGTSHRAAAVAEAIRRGLVA